jgi:quinol monooxygenase YgiN
MFSYHIKLDIKEGKIDEFVETLIELSDGYRKEKGCIDVSLYRDIEKKYTYSLVGEWETIKDMENHFRNKNFSVLIGAAKVLGENLQMNISEPQETGSFELARKKIKLQLNKAKRQIGNI